MTLRVLAPMLLKPVPVALALLVLAAWRRRRWPLLVAIALLWISGTPLTSNLLTQWLERGCAQPDLGAVPESDVILVLSGSDCREVPGRPDLIELNDASRLLGGLELMRAGKAPCIMFTRGPILSSHSEVDEGEVLRRNAEDAGVDPTSIVLVGPASTTREEALAVRAHFEISRASGSSAATMPGPRVILVTSARHMQRAMSTFEAVGVQIVPFPVDFHSRVRITAKAFVPSGNALAETDAALHEIYGRVLYWLQGFVKSPAAQLPHPEPTTEDAGHRDTLRP